MNTLANIHEWLRFMVLRKASDLFLTAGFPPAIKLNGKVSPISKQTFTPADTTLLAKALMSERQQRDFEATHECNFAIQVDEVGRFRVNVFQQQGRTGVVLRHINTQIPKLEELNLPSNLKDITMMPRGLVIVCGATGSGKSTTLAAMIDLINREKDHHIITLEDPIEFIHPRQRCLINQRQLGFHMESFAAGLRAALREDPDVILVGEMRDLDTIQLALTVAETGLLVLGTLHTSSAPKTVDRIIDVFPTTQQAQIRTMLGESLRGVVAQNLLRRADGKGRVAALEVLICNPAVQNLIREGKTFQIVSVMQTGKNIGMQTMAEHVGKLLKDGVITQAEAGIYLGKME